MSGKVFSVEVRSVIFSCSLRWQHLQYICLFSSSISIGPLNFRVLNFFFFLKLSPSNYLSLSIMFTIFSTDLGYLIHNCVLASFLGRQFLFSLYIYTSLPDYFFSVLLRNTWQRLFQFNNYILSFLFGHISLLCRIDN